MSGNSNPTSIIPKNVSDFNNEQHKKHFADGRHNLVIDNGNIHNTDTVVCRKQ
uniref:Uncharacterized protein n=1 Tax=uncultured organism TaxID=155900 RepID=Q0GNL5_9ZZZZ|nr:hypothetical protein [uncultured organism]